jgi:hypothetical protein
MNNLEVVMFSYNRFPHLSLCSKWAIKHTKDLGASFSIFDDGSSDDRVLELLHQLSAQEVKVFVNEDSNKDSFTPAQRIGLQRRRAVDSFLSGDKEYLLMLDDDILIGAGAVQQALDDFELLKARPVTRVGALTLHALVGLGGFIRIEHKVFSDLCLSGEATWLFSREALEQTGNHFGSGPKEFADVQIAQMRTTGYKYYERSWPTYPVQHLGFGVGGSIIHSGRAKPPFWAQGPYVSNYKLTKGRIIDVPGFDMNKYLDLVRMGNPATAPLFYQNRR